VGLTEATKEFPHEYESVTVVTADGKQFKGVTLNEDSFSVQIMDSGEHIHLLEKDKLKSFQKSRASAMRSTTRMCSAIRMWKTCGLPGQRGGEMMARFSGPDKLSLDLSHTGETGRSRLARALKLTVVEATVEERRFSAASEHR